MRSGQAHRNVTRREIGLEESTFLMEAMERVDGTRHRIEPKRCPATQGKARTELLLVRQANSGAVRGRLLNEPKEFRREIRSVADTLRKVVLSEGINQEDAEAPMPAAFMASRFSRESCVEYAPPNHHQLQEGPKRAGGWRNTLSSSDAGACAPARAAGASRASVMAPRAMTHFMHCGTIGV